MFTAKLKQFIWLTLLFLAIFIIVIPVIYLFLIDAHQPGEVAMGIFCVEDNSHILQGLLSHPDHLLNIWFIYFFGSAYCGTPFYYGGTIIMGILISLLELVAFPLLVSLLMAFLYTKAFPIHVAIKDNTKMKRYLTLFLAIVIFLVIRYIKNGFSNPLLLSYGGDPLVNFTPHIAYPQAVLNAFLYGPNANMDRTDPQIFIAAMVTSIILDALVSLLGGFIIATGVKKLFVKQQGKTKR